MSCSYPVLALPGTARYHFVVRYALAFLVLALACGGDDEGSFEPQNCSTEDRAPTFELGLAETGGSGYRVTVTDSFPFPVARDDNDWTITIADGDGAIAAGLDVVLDPQMPDHGHGTPVKATVAETDPGTYEVTRINLWMPGYWEIGVQLRDTTDDLVDTLTFRVCVDP